MDKYRKAYFTLAWILLAAGGLSVAFLDFPTPRPLFVFLISGGATVALFLQIQGRTGRLSTGELVLTVFTALFSGIFLRITGYARVILSGSDHVSHYTVRAAHIINNGYVGPNFGMNTHSPYIHILITSHYRIGGYWLFDVRFAQLLSISLIPLLVFILVRQIDDQKSGAYSLLIATPFPLFHRTMISFMTESLAIPMFVLLLFLLSITLEGERRALLLFLALSLVISGIHFLYPIIILGTVVGVTVLLSLMKTTPVQKVWRGRNRVFPVIGSSAALLFHLSRIFDTHKGSEMFVSIGIVNSKATVPTNPLALFVPTGGSVGKATGSPEGQQLLWNFAPVLFLAVFAVAGAVVMISRMPQQFSFFTLFIIAGVVGTGTLLGLVAFSSGGTMRLGFRIYYFLGIVGLIFASIGMKHLSRYSVEVPSARPVIIVIIAVALFGYASIAPMSSIGNNIDSSFVDSQRYTYSDHEQLQAMDKRLGHGEQIRDIRSYRLGLPPKPFENPLAPTIDGNADQSFVTDETSKCKTSISIWGSGRMTVCQDTSLQFS